MKKILCILALGFAIASCGQAGSLYIPDSVQPKAQTGVQTDTQTSNQ
ncbi:MAG: LPS translocon maturation chaperone LptM [Pseudomonadales bacterium]